jgi:hypothetical protein
VVGVLPAPLLGDLARVGVVAAERGAGSGAFGATTGGAGGATASIQTEDSECGVMASRQSADRDTTHSAACNAADASTQAPKAMRDTLRVRTIIKHGSWTEPCQ